MMISISCSFSRNFVPQLCWSTYTTAHLHLTDLQMWIAEILRFFLPLNKQGKFDSRFPGRVSLTKWWRSTWNEQPGKSFFDLFGMVKWPPTRDQRVSFESHENNLQLHFRKALWKEKVGLFWDESLCTHSLSYLFGYLVDVGLIMKEMES